MDELIDKLLVLALFVIIIPILSCSEKEPHHKVQVLLGDETVLASQKGMAEIFDVSVPTINEHLQNIFHSKELDDLAVIRNFRITASSLESRYQLHFSNIKKLIITRHSSVLPAFKPTLGQYR